MRTPLDADDVGRVYASGTQTQIRRHLKAVNRRDLHPPYGPVSLSVYKQTSHGGGNTQGRVTDAR